MGGRQEVADFKRKEKDRVFREFRGQSLRRKRNSRAKARAEVYEEGRGRSGALRFERDDECRAKRRSRKREETFHRESAGKKERGDRQVWEKLLMSRCDRRPQRGQGWRPEKPGRKGLVPAKGKEGREIRLRRCLCDDKAAEERNWGEDGPSERARRKGSRR